MSRLRALEELPCKEVHAFEQGLIRRSARMILRDELTNFNNLLHRIYTWQVPRHPNWLNGLWNQRIAEF
jgi:hypothetical protein